ncbi:hypothetical protein GCM10009661_84590 [Catellatospora chokoriensis]|uniref:Uncharacterized protein n=1 Tax=Catellatospora chokoriensis TaxID=310353 RepID=A0A8J3K6D4_9ACTN|nr:hypothetical protein Cch02nite_83330 [Catellatospora chokoriensis]
MLSLFLLLIKLAVSRRPYWDAVALYAVHRARPKDLPRIVRELSRWRSQS